MCVCALNKVASSALSVRETGLPVDRAAEAGWQLQFASRAERAARGRRRHATARRLHHGLPQRVLRAPAAAGDVSARTHSCLFNP